MSDVEIAQDLIGDRQVLPARKGWVADPPRSQVITEVMLKAA